MSYFKIKSFAKINLALNIISKKNNIHNIESIVSFINLHDEILIKTIKKNQHKIKFIGKFKSNIGLDNTVSKLLRIIDKKKLLKNKYQIIIKKNIPSKSGFGGGSMNAAAILNYFKKNRLIKISKKEIFKIANLIGSDVVLGIYSKNLIMKSNKQIRTFLIKKKIFVLIVKPNFGCSTKMIYSQVRKFTKERFSSPSKRMFDLKFLKNMKNDLEPIVLRNNTKLMTLKNFLEKLSYVKFVRITGSGSAIIAYFNSEKKCKDAEKKVKKRFKNFWSETSKTI